MAKTTEKPNDPKPLGAENKIAMSTKSNQVNKGAWTAEEDQKLAQVIAIHGAKRWKTIAAIAGLNRCGKSCRLRWLNYLRPNIKRGNISDQEEDLILRLHKLLGNRWSLIAGRLPGRTDNEIKNYWNSHLSKKINHKDNKQSRPSLVLSTRSDNHDCSRNEERRATVQKIHIEEVTREEANNNNNNSSAQEGNFSSHEGSIINSTDFDVDDFFDFSNEGPLNLEWMSKFLELERT